jgi:5-methyltetrahydropteroyltriglutamate--homocysteine methyltransferase
MAVRFHSDNIGSLLRPPELLTARAALRERRVSEAEVRAIEDRAILTALAMQKGAGVQVFTDGEYRRDIFTADITRAIDGLVPGKPVVKFEWRGRGKSSPKNRRRATSSTSLAESFAKKAASRPTRRLF